MLGLTGDAGDWEGPAAAGGEPGCRVFSSCQCWVVRDSSSSPSVTSVSDSFCSSEFAVGWMDECERCGFSFQCVTLALASRR